jgi:hypothetical protein
MEDVFEWKICYDSNLVALKVVVRLAGGDQEGVE